MDDGTGADTADEGEEEAAPEGDEEMEERDLEMLERAEQRFARAPRLEQMARKPLKVGFFSSRSMGVWSRAEAPQVGSREASVLCARQ